MEHDAKMANTRNCTLPNRARISQI